MKENFKVLNLKEEKQLSIEELKEYYKDLREYLLKRKLTNTTPGATTIAPKLKKPVEKIAIKLVEFFTDKDVKWEKLEYTEDKKTKSNWEYDGLENIPEGPVIFAHSHQGILDNFVWMPEVNKHGLILHSKDTMKLLLLAEYTTGLVLVKKGDKKNNNNGKLDMIKLLLTGTSIHYFPESAWNLSPNKLHLPLSFGVIDVAKKAGVPIIPVVHEYTYDTSTEKENIKKIHSRYGKPIYVKETDDLIEKLREYEEKISTIRYDLIMEKGIFRRSDITNFDYINYLKGNYKNLEFGKINVNRERKYLFGADDEFYKFHHINDIPFTSNGELLLPEEVRRLKTINQENEIKRVKKLIKELNYNEEMKRKKALQRYYQK